MTLHIYSGECEHGECGLQTNLKDGYDNNLFVGDIVSLATYDEYGIRTFYGLSVVVDGRPELVGVDEQSPFVMGISSVDINNSDEWIVHKVKSYQDCIDGEHWSEFGFNYIEKVET